MKDSVSCDHANEVPVKCPCDDDCYCKEHTCKNTIPISTGMNKTQEIHTSRGNFLMAESIVKITELYKQYKISVEQFLQRIYQLMLY